MGVGGGVGWVNVKKNRSKGMLEECHFCFYRKFFQTLKWSAYIEGLCLSSSISGFMPSPVSVPATSGVTVNVLPFIYFLAYAPAVF